MNLFGKKMIWALFFMVLASMGWADEKKDHVCFKVLDKDRDSLVTFEEFKPHYGDDKATFDAADANADGKLTHEEYHTLLGHGASK